MSEQDRIDRLEKRIAELEESLRLTDAELQRHAVLLRPDNLHKAVAKEERRREARR